MNDKGKTDFSKYLDLAQQYSKDGNHKSSIEFWQKVVDVKPDFSAGWVMMGQEYEKLQQSTMAIKCYSNALRVDPLNEEAYWFRKELLGTGPNVEVFTVQNQKVVGNCVKCGSTEDLVFYTELEPILDSVKRIHIRKFYSATTYKYKGAIEKRLITCPKCKKSFEKWGRISFILFSMIFVSLVVVPGISLMIFLLQELNPEGTTDSGKSFTTMIISLIVSIILIILYIFHSRSKSCPKYYFLGGKSYRDNQKKLAESKEKNYLLQRNPKELYNKGLRFYNQGFLRDAYTSFKDVLAINPEQKEQFKQEILDFLTQFNEADNIFKEGEDLLQRGNLKKALKSVNKALEIYPEYPIALSVKGSILSKLGKYNEALEELNKALELKPDLNSAENSKDFVLRMLNGNK